MQSDHSKRIQGVLYGKRQAVKNILYIHLKCTTEIFCHFYFMALQKESLEEFSERFFFFPHIFSVPYVLNFVLHMIAYLCDISYYPL